VWKYRIATSHSRILPHFIIIGAQKSGTTSLYHYLSQHNLIIPAVKKEVHYFDLNYQRGLSWYKAHFPRLKNIHHNEKVFEASPSYLYHPLVPRRIAKDAPQAKLIILLRNPTERAISQYFHERRMQHEDLPIMDALKAEEERLKPIIEKGDLTNSLFFYSAYKSRGCYAEQLIRYFDLFGRENILILNSDLLFSQTMMTLKIILNFVSVEGDFSLLDEEAKNVSDNRTRVDEAVYEYLDDYFISHNQQLFSLLGEDYGWNDRRRQGGSTT